MIDNVGQRVKPTHVYKGSVRRLWKALYVRAPPGPLHQPQDHRRSGDTSEQVQQKEPVAQDCEAKAMLRPPPAVLPWTWSWCDVCGFGRSMHRCPDCDGEGYVNTQPGGAGVPFYVGTARCKACQGMGVVACFMCGGAEVELDPPDPVKGPPAVSIDDLALSDTDWLAVFPDSRTAAQAPPRRRKKKAEHSTADVNCL